MSVGVVFAALSGFFPLTFPTGELAGDLFTLQHLGPVY